MKKYGILLSVVFVVSLGLIMFFQCQRAESEEDTNIPIFASIPDSLVIYQGDMALAHDQMNVYSGKKMQIILPPQAVAESVQIFDGGVKVENFTLSSVASAGGEYANQYAQSGYGGNNNLLSWTSNKTGSRQITLDYMMRGLSWTPSYIMHIDSPTSVGFHYRVGIRNSTPFSSDVNLKLVSGIIGSPQSGSGIYYRQMNNTQFKMDAYERQQSVSATTGSSIGATKISAYYTYDLPKAKLEKGGISYVTILDKKLDAKKEFVWVTTTGERVDVVYTVKNSTDQPFAEGLVNVYQNKIFMGSDVIEWTPSGGEGHVTVGGALDLQAVKTVDIEEDPQRSHNKEYRHEMTLTVNNYSKESKTVKVIDQKYADCVELKFTEKPEKSLGGTYMWNLTIPAGGKKEISYIFYSDSRYSGAYQKY